MAVTPSYIGKGIYSVPDAARIVGIHYNTARTWLDPHRGLIPRTFIKSEQLVSFAELMELHFVKMFRDEGVSLQAIRKAAKTAAKQFHSDYPFAVKRFDTDGKTIFATLAKESGNEELVEDLKKGQYVFANIIRPFFKKLDYDTTEIARFWPMNKRGRVVLDPQRQFGRPLDDETGVPTRALFNAVTAGEGQTVREVANWFQVPEKAVRAAVAFERSLAA